MPRPNTYIWESVSPGLVPAVQAMSRLLSSTTTAVSLLLLSFRLALTVLPFIWRHIAEPWCYYQYGNAIFLCAHDDVTSFPFFFKGCTCLGFAQVGNLSVTPTKLCLHRPPPEFPSQAWVHAGQEETPAKGMKTSVVGSSPCPEGWGRTNSSTHSFSLGQQRVLQRKSLLLPVVLKLPALMCLCFSPEQMICLVKGRIQATIHTLLLKRSHLGS